MDKIVDPGLYDKDYYLKSNIGYEEFLRGLENSRINYKFQDVLNCCSFSEKTEVLDIGCGRGELVYYCAKNGCKKALGIDYSSAAIDLSNSFKSKLDKKIQDRIVFKNIDALELSSQEKYDYIFMVEVWEHMYDSQLFPLLNKIHSLLKDNGLLILTTPNGLYEKFLFPAKRISNIPFNMIKFPLRILKGKWKPSSFSDLLKHIFKIRAFSNTFMDKTHINISTPGKIKKMLQSCNFKAQVKCKDSSKNPISIIFSHWAGREMIITAKKQYRRSIY
jgi:2-polyprenyl-3-methyl-5-hydroxy-6-metoxy-1,4-benzoquinol methylase